MNVPRAAYMRFPYGFPIGPAFQPELQQMIVFHCLSLISKIQEPGTIIQLPYRWKGIKSGKYASADPRIQELLEHVDSMLDLLDAISEEMKHNYSIEEKEFVSDGHKLSFYNSQKERAKELYKFLENDIISKIIGLRNLSGPIKYLKDEESNRKAQLT